MPEPRVIYHIGQHKTGTTSLQNALLAQRQKLATQGVLFPELGHPRYPAGQSDANHNALHYLFHRPQHPWIDESSLEAARKLRTQVTAATPDRIVISAEDAFFIGDRKTASELNSIDAIVPYEKDVVVFLRRPDDYISSWQKQTLKFGAKVQPLDSKERLAKVLKKCLGDYRKALEPFVERYDSVRAFVYKPGMDTTQIFFEEVLGLPAPKPSKSNPSVPDAFAGLALDFVRENRRLKPRELKRLIRKDPGVRVDLLGAENRKRLAQHYEPIVEWLTATFGPEVTFDLDAIATVPETSISVEQAEADYRKLFTSALDKD